MTRSTDEPNAASAPIETASFAKFYQLQAAGERDSAPTRWRSVADLTRLLFVEPSPAPIKHWLWRSGLIHSVEVRLPMTQVSPELAARIDREIERRISIARRQRATRRAPGDRLRGEANRMVCLPGKTGS
jgi:4-hydroxy-tetrahydrodipicolinate synthase